MKNLLLFVTMSTLIISCDGSQFVFDPSGDFILTPDQDITLTSSYSPLSTVQTTQGTISNEDFWALENSTASDSREGYRFTWNSATNELTLQPLDLLTEMPTGSADTILIDPANQQREFVLIDATDTTTVNSGCDLETSRVISVELSANSEIARFHFVSNSRFVTTDPTMVTCFDHLTDYRDDLTMMSTLGIYPDPILVLSSAVSFNNFQYLSSYTLETYYSVEILKNLGNQEVSFRLNGLNPSFLLNLK